MSTWNLGINDVSEQERVFKDKIFSKDAHITALQEKLAKQAQDMQGVRDAYNEKIGQLAEEAKRAIFLEGEVKRHLEALQNEKNATQNMNQALVIARDTIRQQKLDDRDLAANLEQLSHLSDEHKARADNLAEEKAALEARVRELQSNQYRTPVPSKTPGRQHPTSRSRSRSSSPSSSKARVANLEHELTHLRSSLQQRELDIQSSNEKASHAQNELIRVGNEKTALERRMHRELAEVKFILEKKEEEMRSLKDMFGNQDREIELEQRIEEDEAKMVALTKSFRADEAKLRKEIKNLEAKLKEETRRAAEAEQARVEQLREKEGVLADVQLQISVLREGQNRTLSSQNDGPQDTLMEVDDESAATVARLLSAISRLRTERDALQRSFDFLQSESRFEIEALNARLADVKTSLVSAAVAGTDELRPNPAQPTSGSEHGSIIHSGRRQLSATMACLVVIQHISAETQALEERRSQAHSSRDQVVMQLADAKLDLSGLEDQLKDLEVKLDVTTLRLEATTSQRDDLLSKLENKELELEQAVSGLKSAEESENYYKQQLDNTEAERNSLSLQLAHLQQELSVARENLKAAETRYSDLQFHQLDAMSQTEATRLMQKELTDEQARVKRREEHIVMLQHDIQRLETNLRLQEERLGEMTTELEMMSAAKDAMVDDCADAREARDLALKRMEGLETEMEARLEASDVAVETLVGVIMKTIAKAKDKFRRQDESLRATKEAMNRLEADWKLTNRNAARSIEASRQPVIALAVSQVSLQKALAYIRAIAQEKETVRHEAGILRGHLAELLTERKTLVQQLDDLRSKNESTSLNLINRTAELEREINDLHQTMRDTEAAHRLTIEELLSSKAILSASLDEARKSGAEHNRSDELAYLQEQHALELNEIRSHLSESRTTLEELQASHVAAKEALEKSLMEVMEAKRQLELQLADSLKDLERATLQRDLEEQKREELEQRLLHLSGDLEDAVSQAAAANGARDELQASLDCVSGDLATLRQEKENSIVKLTEQNLMTRRQLEDEHAQLQSKFDEQSRLLSNAVKETQQWARKLEEESDAHKADEESYARELALAESQRKNLDSALSQLKQEIETTQTELLTATQAADKLKQDKSSLQEENTSLEAEIQRSLSFGRFLESQVKESEAKIASLVEELEKVQAEMAFSKKAASAAETKLSLQVVQHKREMSELNRQLATLQSQPDLQHALTELKERNNDLEDSLRSKCAEIEENDDRALEMLKENKKFSAKIETLTRKVQSLQAKLAAVKASALSSQASNPSIPSQALTPAPFPTSTAVVKHPKNIPTTIPPVPPLPHFSHTFAPPTPQRAVSGPSSIPRPKTPEPRMAQATPVFRPRTPERRAVSSPAEEPSSSTSMIGKKRRAPEDFEASEGLPPQGFTIDSLPSREEAENNSTPRARRGLANFQSGFTPVRDQGRPILPMPSPKRLIKGITARSLPAIADVTNSPRGQSASKTKRSWLGKIRNTSSQASGLLRLSEREA